MSLLLYRLGRWSYRHRWWVVGVWAILLATVLGVLANQGSPKISSSLTVDGTQSEKVLNELHAQFPEMSGSQGTIVFRAEGDARLDDASIAVGLQDMVDEINALDAVAQRPDMTELLPDLGDIPDDVDLTKLQNMMTDLPADTDVAGLQQTLADMPADVQLAEIQTMLADIPADTDLVQLQQTMASLPEGVDVAQLQQQLANVPPGTDPAQLQQMLNLPPSVDVAQLQQTMSQLPDSVDLPKLQTMMTQFPADTDLDALHKTLGDLPEDMDPAEVQDIMAALPQDADLTELQQTMADIPAGTDLNQLQEMMDVDLLTVEGQQVPGMLLSDDAGAGMFQIQLAQQIEDLPEADLAEIITIAESQAQDLGITALTTESLKPQQAPLGGSEVIGLAIAALVLILTLGSLRAAGLPLITAVVGVGIGLGGALTLSNVIELTSATPVLALMVGLAVGIDYALFIVNRARQLILIEGINAYEAAGRAVGTAGSAVVFAGLTVVIALTGLTLIGISFLTTMALVAAVTVILAVLVALSLLPALLSFVGEHIVSQRARNKLDTVHATDHSVGRRWAKHVVSSRGIITTLIILVLGVAAIPAASMNFGMPSGATANLDTTERQAYDAITEGFGQGYNAPLLTVTQVPDGNEIDPMELPVMAQNLADMQAVDTAQPMGVSDDGSVAIISVIPHNGPDAQSTADLVQDLRADGSTTVGVADASFGVAGLTAVNLDISEKLADVLPTYITIIVVLSLIVLMLVFRSILIPLKATLGFLLSIGATFGIITAIFQWGWFKDLFGFDTTGPILSFLPIMVTGILYGLAMDYQMFLVSSMREAHVHGHKGNAAITQGFSLASRVVVAAALIMVSVFAGFIFSSDPMVKQFGTALAIGILIDAFLIRLTLVPAVMSFLGKTAWWLPGWLDRILPNLDIEGRALTKHLDQEKHPSTPPHTAP